ncbi:MAG: TetR/AcrR family transcriptional regulator [Alphaproteobacteria bacterium]|nr:TetR/AcrR family transcriptional regulator [Alphaproteobacteria bacterium]MDP6238428.1 TetR/AcrR family transcriptional regulator [Alphaproteobacteria bacterium]MDP7172614.1 TetR/AcrR family transcriptional regulator [Alphaproteobacteria bacterium]MDP7234277.1 TetR/AcrR family transcriptional regulator [Alphaproteobacteria bacterium]MDP7486899.1 TetR/AcrR family transcriptional regulator [Alphaproteobacteria bacterium]
MPAGIRLSGLAGQVRLGFPVPDTYSSAMADRSERKERLVAALSDMFCTHGYGGASVAVLVRAAGLSKASLYHHFPGGKEARLEVGMLAPLAGESPLPERVDAMMVAVAS